MSQARFPPTARVRARADFDRTFRDGRRVALPMLALHWRHGAGQARLGLAVSRKVDRRAVVRNRIRRILREHFRLLRAQLPGGDYVFVARSPAATAAPADLREACRQLLRRAGALPHPAADGTMPAPQSSPASPPSSDTPHPAGE
ncbi:ribonuclease P protein component [Luteimonas sp. J16]|jgi:ribonuclease P protein component|uniref:ribonuclease P protein component n=1 Tax=unclassified Luteimonas TaxID=2629088 RepID=UPI0004B6942E|nr:MULTISPECIES: ribonuclease P protein component [unclassified Luteimonas]TWG90920.1 ribonuclease P protein component [Luteimonas sp. J16]